MKAPQQPDPAKPGSRRTWETPSVTPVGTVTSVLRAGDNKVTVVAGDPGEPRKLPGGDK
jgi:hypothetical protein